MIVRKQLNRAFAKIGLPAALLFALIGIACTEGDDGDDTLLTGAALALSQATNSSSAGAATCAGSGHRLIFVPAANATVNTGITGLDSQCQSATDKPSGGGTYKAMVADGTNRIACTTANCGGGTSEHTDWVLKPNKEYRRSDGTTVIGTTSANGVFAFPLTNSMKATIVGTNTTATGLSNNWTSNANDCSNWGDNTNGSNSNIATHDSTTTAAIDVGGTIGCGNTLKFICVEQ